MSTYMRQDWSGSEENLSITLPFSHLDTYKVHPTLAQDTTFQSPITNTPPTPSRISCPCCLLFPKVKDNTPLIRHKVIASKQLQETSKYKIAVKTPTLLHQSLVRHRYTTTPCIMSDIYYCTKNVYPTFALVQYLSWRSLRSYWLQYEAQRESSGAAWRKSRHASRDFHGSIRST
jgi:hypothetical protein